MPRSFHRARWALPVLLVCSGAAHAEEGDYDRLTRLRHLVRPPAVDNPVRPDERRGDFPLRAAGAEWQDGFEPRRYFKWQAVTLDPATGARCANGTPYTFFVNRTPNTANTVVIFEPGGACWGPNCLDRKDPLGAVNADGIPRDYMKLIDFDFIVRAGSGFWPFVKLEAGVDTNALQARTFTPFVTRVHPYERIKTQAWNLVFLPYCTGDTHAGAHEAPIAGPDGSSVDWSFAGALNARAVTGWMRDNLQRPVQLLVTGCSAGGLGATVNYHPMRRDLAASRGFLLADSGPIFSAPRGADPAEFPSAPLFETLRRNWAIDRASVNPLTGSTSIANLLAGELPAFDANDLGTIYRALAGRWVDDRFGIYGFGRDGLYSAYSYHKFHPDLAGKTDAAAVLPGLMRRWDVDMGRLKAELDALSNVGGYFPQYRDLFFGHCGTTLDFGHGDIPERGTGTPDFIASVLDGKGPVLHAAESSPAADFARARAGRVAPGPTFRQWMGMIAGIGEGGLTRLAAFRDWIYAQVNAMRGKDRPVAGFDPLTPIPSGDPGPYPDSEDDCRPGARCR